MSIPNCLTWLRILLIPVFVVAFYLPWGWATFITLTVFLLAAITDWLDGFLARSLKQTSRFGAFLDPVADKLIVVTALVLLVGEQQYPFLALPAAIIVGREIVVSALREWMAEIGKRTSVAVSLIGKVKTLLQLLAIFLLLANRAPVQASYYFYIGWMGYIMLYASAGMTLWSMYVYWQAAKGEMSQ